MCYIRNVPEKYIKMSSLYQFTYHICFKFTDMLRACRTKLILSCIHLWLRKKKVFAVYFARNYTIRNERIQIKSFPIVKSKLFIIKLLYGLYSIIILMKISLSCSWFYALFTTYVTFQTNKLKFVLSIKLLTILLLNLQLYYAPMNKVDFILHSFFTSKIEKKKKKVGGCCLFRV